VRILFVVHQYLPRWQAGTEIYTHSLAKELAQRHQVMVYCHEPALDGGGTPVLLDTYDGVSVRRLAAWLGPDRPSPWRAFRLGFANERIEKDYERALSDFSPDIVHVQHLKELSAGLLGRTSRRGVPLVMTLHDYWALCGNAQYLRPDGTICRRTHFRLECGSCAAARVGRPALRFAAPLMIPLFLQRQFFMRRQMRHVRVFVAPSFFLRDRYVASGYPAERIRQIGHGLDLDRLSAAVTSPRGEFRGRYAFIGSLAWQKGVHVVVDAFRELGDVGAELRIWGNPQVFPDYSRLLRERAAGCPWIELEGELDHARVGEALAWADYLIVPSLWWETWSLVVSEAFAAGVPVIASDLGALPERVRDGQGGLLFRPGSVQGLLRVLRRTIEEPGLLAQLRAGLPRVAPIAEHAKRIEEIYADLLERD